MAEPKPGVAFVILTGPVCISDEHGKVMVFRDRAVIERIIKERYTVRTQEERQEIRMLEEQTGHVLEPVIMAMSAIRWAAFQNQKVGKYTEYTDYATAIATIDRKRDDLDRTYGKTKR